MLQFLLPIILLLSGSTYWFYSETQTLKENNVKLELAVEEQKRTMEVMRENFERQSKALNNLQTRNAQIEAEKDQYLAIFRKHNLDKLALMKPGLVQTRVRNETKAVFEELENDSKNIADLNNSTSD
jgi:hypothetical protein